MPKLPKIKIKEIDFKKVSRIQKNWDDAFAYCRVEDRTIWIDKNLPSKTQYGKFFVLEHEKAHIALCDSGIKEIKSQTMKEDIFCDWFGLVRSADKHLQQSELYFKRWLLNGRKWGKKSDRSFIVKRILSLLGVRTESKNILKLTN